MSILYGSLEGKSGAIVPEIFEHFWRKKNGKAFSLISLPHTVIFEKGLPTAWYFTATSGEVKRKCEDKLSRQHILDTFLKPAARSRAEVVAVLYTNDSRPYGHSVNVQYFDAPSLRSWLGCLFSQESFKYGVLQKFVDPHGLHNSSVRVWWTHEQQVVTQRRNVHALNDITLNLEARLATYHGSVSRARDIDAPSNLRHGVEQHVAAVSGIVQWLDGLQSRVRVEEITAYFKLDADGTIWFLWGGDLRTSRERLSMRKAAGLVITALRYQSATSPGRRELRPLNEEPDVPDIPIDRSNLQRFHVARLLTPAHLGVLEDIEAHRKAPCCGGREITGTLDSRSDLSNTGPLASDYQHHLRTFDRGVTVETCSKAALERHRIRAQQRQSRGMNVAASPLDQRKARRKRRRSSILSAGGFSGLGDSGRLLMSLEEKPKPEPKAPRSLKDILAERARLTSEEKVMAQQLQSELVKKKELEYEIEQLQARLGVLLPGVREG